MPAAEMDTSGWAVPPHPVLQSHHVMHALSRRAFLGAAGATGAVLATGVLWPGTSLAATRSNAAPKPTTNTSNIGGTNFHLTFPGPGVDPSSITDFNGFVGIADVRGTGTATNPDGSTEILLFDTDMRFMTGVYVGVDGRVHKGTFGFV